MGPIGAHQNPKTLAVVKRTMTNSLISSSTLAGDNVVNLQGENLGSIKDLMIDVGSGTIEYAVLSFGGLLGLGDKLFAIPFKQLSVDHENRRMVLAVDKERLESAPGFDKNDWPDFADPIFRSSVDSHYV